MKSILGATFVAGVLSLVVAFHSPSAMSQQTKLSAVAQWSGFNAPTAIASGVDGTVYVSNWGGNTVERIAPDGSRSIFLDKISSPAGIAIDKTGAVFVSSYSGDYIVRVSPEGAASRVAEGLATPTGIAFSSSGRLLVANRASGEILSMDTANGERRTIARSLSLPVGVVEMPDGSIVTSQYGGRVTRILPNGEMQELGKDFVRPGVGILADGNEAVLVIDNGAGAVRRVSFAGQSQVVGQGFEGSSVALGRAGNGELLVGAWGSGIVYRLKPSE